MYTTKRGIWFEFTDEQWELLKKYAEAKRKYEHRKPFSMKFAAEEIFFSMIEALESEEIYDSDGNLVNWNPKGRRF